MTFMPADPDRATTNDRLARIEEFLVLIAIEEQLHEVEARVAAIEQRLDNVQNPNIDVSELRAALGQAGDEARQLGEIKPTPE